MSRATDFAEPFVFNNTSNKTVLISGSPVGPRDVYLSTGLSIREYMAVHSTQPGVSEICAVAGVKCDGHTVYLEMRKYSFNEWWETLPLTERLDLASKVRVMQADSLIRELEKPRAK